jgi:hypothetical protein
MMHKLRPELRPLDWRVLGSVVAAGPEGLPLAYVRRKGDYFGSLTSFLPAAQRLTDEGLIVQQRRAYGAADYPGKTTRPDREDVYYVRTARPIDPNAFVL